ncbi:MAG: TraR/DksA family transcriptional regulator [Pseudomonadota bacterium]
MATLSSQQLDMFKEILRERREQLRRLIHDALIATNRDDYLELAGSVHDAGDESVANLLQGLNLAQREREVEELTDVEAALTRIAEDRYGICLDCDDTITPARLEAWPTAKRCMSCQSRLEARRRGGKDPTPSL